MTLGRLGSHEPGRLLVKPPSQHSYKEKEVRGTQSILTVYGAMLLGTIQWNATSTSKIQCYVFQSASSLRVKLSVNNFKAYNSNTKLHVDA